MGGIGRNTAWSHLSPIILPHSYLQNVTFNQQISLPHNSVRQAEQGLSKTCKIFEGSMSAKPSFPAMARRFTGKSLFAEAKPEPSGSTAERSERAKRFAARRSNSKLSLNDRHSEDVGTVKELDDAIKGARQALREFARTAPPKATMSRAFYFGNCVCTFRFLLQ